MELIEGPKDSVRNLEQAIRDGVLYEGTDVQVRLLSLGVQIAFAIEHIHSRGVVHQDIKPANILVDASDEHAHWWLVLTDFGVSSSGEAMPAAGGGVTIISRAEGMHPIVL
jgi:serine/threonine protein kinase